jgi:hypothetical protein
MEPKKQNPEVTTFKGALRRFSSPERSEAKQVERRRALSIITDPGRMDWGRMRSSEQVDLNRPLRIWFWLKAGISLALNYRVSLWATDCVSIAAWDVKASWPGCARNDWTELVVRPGLKLGFDTYRNSSYL